VKFNEAGATIKAPPAAVWSVLTDGAGLTSWPSGIERFEGEIREGAKIKLYSEASPGRAFPLKVVEIIPNRRMVWKGGMPLGLFTGVRTYTLTEEGDHTHFKMREEFTGPLTSMIWRTMPDLGPSFTKFAEGLKATVEGRISQEETP
jgi:hypothetical protein